MPDPQALASLGHMTGSNDKPGTNDHPASLGGRGPFLIHHLHYHDTRGGPSKDLFRCGRLGSASHPCEDEAQDNVAAEPEYMHRGPFPIPAPESWTNVSCF